MTVRRRDVLASALGTLSALACGNALGGGAKTPGESELIGAKAPEFSLAPAGGGAPLSPKSFEGKVLIVDFWATWCKPCRESFPAYQRLIDKYDGAVAVLGVSVDEEPDGIEAFRAETGVRFPLVWDDGQVAASVYKPGTMPTCYVVDRAGFVQFIHEGFRAGDEATFERHVKDLL